MNNRQVAHLWANKARPHAKGSSFYFDGDTIYSYGRHFPIARHVERKGEHCVLFTTRGYSNTTARHISYARSALHDVPIFYVQHPANGPHSNEIRADYQSRIYIAVCAAASARSRAESHIAAAQCLALEANQCAKFFGWRWRMKAEFSPEMLQAARAAAKKAQAKRAAMEAKRAAHAAVELAKAITEWRAGGHNYLARQSPETLLRVKGDVIQTSRGAEIPVAHAARLWAVIVRARKGAPYQHNGHTEHAGEFKVDSVDTEGTLRAGCHTIRYPELRRLAESLGLPT